MLGSLDLFGRHIWDQLERLAGALLLEEIRDLQRFGGGTLILMKIELQAALAPMSVEAVVVGEEGWTGPKNDFEPTLPFPDAVD